MTAIFACWVGFNMQKKLDQYDWHFHRPDIWVDFWLTLIFWPLIAVLRPRKLYMPAFKYDRLWGDAAECTRQRISFMENPPPCASTVVYRTFRDDEKERNGIFYFNAANVQAMAEHMKKEHTSLEGMYGAARWTSLRDESLAEPTEVPELLVNFDHIAEELIEAGHGQVRCLACNKIYSSSELTRNCGFYGGWLIADYLCPSQHKLLSREVAHFMFSSNY